MNNIINLQWACNEAFENRLKLTTKALTHAARILNQSDLVIGTAEITELEMLQYGLSMGLSKEEIYNGK